MHARHFCNDDQARIRHSVPLLVLLIFNVNLEKSKQKVIFLNENKNNTWWHVIWHTLKISILKPQSVGNSAKC